VRSPCGNQCTCVGRRRIKADTAAGTQVAGPYRSSARKKTKLLAPETFKYGVLSIVELYLLITSYRAMLRLGNDS